jgi:hypothetical protein
VENPAATAMALIVVAVEMETGAVKVADEVVGVEPSRE